MKPGAILTVAILGAFVLLTAGSAGAFEAYSEERMSMEETPVIGSFEYQEFIETGSLPSERSRAGWEASPREIGAPENGTWGYEEYGNWPPESAGMTETGSLPREEFETVELSGVEYRINVDLGGGE